MIGWKNVRLYVNSCDRNRLVFASWRFRLRREYDGVVDANILKIVRRLLLWWHVHNSFLVYVAFFVLPFNAWWLSSKVTWWLSNKVQSTNHRKLRCQCYVFCAPHDWLIWLAPSCEPNCTFGLTKLEPLPFEDCTFYKNYLKKTLYWQAA